MNEQRQPRVGLPLFFTAVREHPAEAARIQDLIQNSVQPKLWHGIILGYRPAFSFGSLKHPTPQILHQLRYNHVKRSNLTVAQKKI